MSEPDYSTIDFISDKERELFEEARLGVDLQSFLNQTAGRYLHERARNDLERIRNELQTLNPFEKGGRTQWEDLQREAWCAEHFLLWCVEAIRNGNESRVNLESFRDPEGEH